MYTGLPREYKKRFSDFFRKRRHWIGLVLYDNRILAFVLRKGNGEDKVDIPSVKWAASRGIKGGRIVNSRTAGAVMCSLLKSVTAEAKVKDDRVLLGLDIPALKLTPKQWTDNRCLKVPCDATTYKRMLRGVVRESTIDSQHIIEIMPLRITMDERLVEDPLGITGQMTMDNLLISLTYQDKNDFEGCLKGIKYTCESFFSGFHNLCSAFPEFANEGEYVLLIDLKYNSTDIVMFRGSQPLAMKCYKQGLDEIILYSLAYSLNIGRNGAIRCFKRYCDWRKDIDGEIVGEEEVFGSFTALKYWEIHESVMGQLKNFIVMRGGISDLLTKLHQGVRALPERLLITGKGACIPEIDKLFENRLNVKAGLMNWSFPGIAGTVPATAYGMARSIARDIGAGIHGVQNA